MTQKKSFINLSLMALGVVCFAFLLVACVKRRSIYYQRIDQSNQFDMFDLSCDV